MRKPNVDQHVLININVVIDDHLHFRQLYWPFSLYLPLAHLDYLLLGHNIHVGCLGNARWLLHSTLAR